MFLLRISKSTKDGTVCLPSPLRVTVNELTIYTDFLSNPGSVLGKYEEIDKANDILCSTSLIDHKKIIYTRNYLLVNNGLDSIHNGLLPSIFANCTVTTRIVIFMGRSHYISRCKIKRTKRPCAYYCNSLASFRCPLEGDLVFKLNPGPMDDQQIIRPHYSLLRSVSLSTRTRDLSKLITVERVPALAGLNTYLPNDQLRFCVMNAQSLNNKAGELTDFVCEYRPDIVARTETWFYETESASRTLCTPSGYNLLDHPRVNRRGGGTGVLFRNNLSVKKSDAGELRTFEYSEWDVLAGTQRTHLVIIYRIPYSVAHPVTTSVFLEEFSKFLESTVFCANHLLITSDFNIHMDVADDTDAVRLHELLESVGLQQHVTVPPHISEHTLDFIITRQSDLLGISKPWAGYLFSDHMPVHCQLTISKPSLRKTQIAFRKMKSISVNTLCEELLSSDLYTNVDTYDLNELVKCYDNTLKSALDRHAPVIKKTITKRPTVPWFTNEVKSAKRDRRRCLDVLLPILTKMINLSLQTGCFPEECKLADVKPVLKKSSAEKTFSNLRPISNLPFVGKLIERAVFGQTHNYLTAHELYPKTQSAYREFHSNETTLLRVKNDILLNMNQQRVTLLVLLDLSAAFDTVDHIILLDRLYTDFGISGHVHSWFTSYLSSYLSMVEHLGGLK